MDKIEQNQIQLPIKWSALEYGYIPKSPDWFWVIGIITTALFVAVAILGNILFAVFIAIAGFTIAMYGARKPQTANFAIQARGIEINKTLYAYGNLKSFWIHYDPPRKKELSVQSEKMFMPYIKIPLGDIDPNIVREVLLKFLKEREHQESLIDILGEYLRF